MRSRLIISCLLHFYVAPAGLTLKGAKFAGDGQTLKMSRRLLEPKYMNLNSHPPPDGVVIAGNGLGTPDRTELCCAAWPGNGNFIARGFGPAAFNMNGARGEANRSVHNAAGVGEPVTQEIAVSVKGNRVECSIRGTVLAGYDKSALVIAGN